MTSHYDPHIVSPRPHRTDNPAADLDNMGGASHPQTQTTTQPPTYSSYAMPAPSFGANVQVPMSAPAAGPGSDWSPWAFTAAPRSPFPQPPPAPPTPAAGSMNASSTTHRPSSTTSTSLTATLPSVPTLLEALPSITSPALDGNLKVTWARDVFFLVDRAHHLHLALTTPVGQPIPSVSDPITGALPSSALDPDIVTLASTAVPLILAIASPYPHGQPYNQGNNQGMQGFEAEAVYMRAVLASTGAFPQHLPFNPKGAFRDFETAARGGYAGAWYRLARDYEAFGDLKHAKDCFERGAKLGVESCLYRLGMAQLLGQLTMQADVGKALPILQRAAVLASLECPQPAYVYSLLLLSEFSSIAPIAPAIFASLSSIPSYPPPPTHPSTALTPLIPLGSSPHLESRHHLERAAYLHYGPAQYKLGHAYEFADPPFYFDPLLSVQYYSLASQGGEVEADMALSKWFLCGAAGGSGQPGGGGAGGGGGFEKDEGLALTFAQKASSRNLTSAHFAMGYYAEVGVGRPVSVPDAVHYYTLAANAGNVDARGRLDVLGRESAESHRLSKGVHEQRVERTRTMAQRRTEETPMSPPYQGQTFPSLAEAQKVAMSAGAGPQGFAGNLPVPGSGNALAPPTSALAALSLSPQRAAGQRDPRAVVELVRKSTMSTYQPLNSAAIQGQAPPLPRPPQSATPSSYTPSTAPSYASTPSSAYPTTPTATGPSRLDLLRNPQPVSARPPSAGTNNHNHTQPHQGFGPRPPSAGPRPPSAGKNRPQSQFPGTTGGGGGGGYASPRPQSAYPMPPHSAAPAGTYGRTESRPESQGSGVQSYGGYQQGGGGGGYGGQQGGQGGGGGQGGRRPQSPGRKASPGPGRMGKLRVGVEEYGVPPVPGSGAPPNTANPPSTANPANANTPGLAAPNTSLAGQTPRPTGKHPATFAEMGIQGAKAEDKDCKVM